jgi:hypothetical protein
MVTEVINYDWTNSSNKKIYTPAELAKVMLEGAKNAVPIPWKAKARREDIVFFKEEDMSTFVQIQRVLWQAMNEESVTTIEDVTPRSKHLSSRKYIF